MKDNILSITFGAISGVWAWVSGMATVITLEEILKIIIVATIGGLFGAIAKDFYSFIIKKIRK
jgi:hypothetical protein